MIDSRQARALDSRAKEKLGIPTLILMENAGRAVFEEAMKMLRGKKEVAVFCGKGNNGGDGFVAARHLLSCGIKPGIFLTGSINEVVNEAKTNLEILLKLKQKIFEINEENLNLVKNRISKYALVIDALLGVGLSGEVRGIFRDLINIINAAKVKVLAVDIPSGLDANTGEILGCGIIADSTVTFVAKKRGMAAGQGRKYCGKIIVKDLGVRL